MQTKDNNAALRNLAALVDFSNLINSTLDIDFILNNLLFTCFGKFQTAKGIVALFNPEGILVVEASKGVKQAVVEKFPDNLNRNFENDKEFKSFLEENNFPLFQKINYPDGAKGILILGARLVKKPYTTEDKEFLKTILNISATALENSQTVTKLKDVNRELDEKVNQLSSLFDLSKEFGGILEVNTIVRLLTYSIIGQMLVSKYAVVTCNDDEYSILECKFLRNELKEALKKCNKNKFNHFVVGEELQKEYKELYKIGAALIVPMKIKNETKGLIILGSRKTNIDYSKTDIEFVSSVGSLAIISIENARLFQETLEKEKMEKDLEIARNIQKNLLPKSIPQMKYFDIAAFNNSARQVGGDYYDLVELDDKRLLFAIGDVSGKGVSAALLMANAQAFLKSICKQDIPLNEATNMINDLISENTTLGSFITFFWGILNDETKILEYVNAGHNPPFLVRNGKITKLKTGGMILGVMETMVPYQSEKIELKKDDSIILFTDGITEAMNTKNEEFSDERLEKLAVDIYQNNAENILEIITSNVSEFTAGAEQSDDITSLIIKVK